MLGQKLEGAISLELDPLSGHIGEKEAEVNMEHFSTPVKQNVTVVPIFRLNYIHYQ